VWSFPAKDATDVPLDADLLIITVGFGDGAHVRLDDEELDAASELPGHYDLGTLQPHTHYTISITDREPQAGASEPAKVSWTFTTGDETAKAGRAGTLDVDATHVRMVMQGEKFDCADALYAHTCFDTGLPQLYTFDTGTDADVALWVIERVAQQNEPPSSFSTLPAECGSPRLLGYEFDLANPTRYRVNGVLRDGTILTSKVVTPQLTMKGASTPARTMPIEDTCSAAGTSAPSWSWLAPAAVLALLRRSRRAKRARELT
jgi:hypothetical protein